MSLSTFTVVHVALSLIGIAAGLVAAAGMLASRTMPGITALFLFSTLLGNVTGLLFPSLRFGLGHSVGIVSLLILLPTFVALYLHHLAGPWRWIFSTGALAALWLNGVIAVMQSFAKVALLQPCANAETVLWSQAVLFLVFALWVALAARRFHPEMPPAGRTHWWNTAGGPCH
jgi:hypothetical protein